MENPAAEPNRPDSRPVGTPDEQAKPRLQPCRGCGKSFPRSKLQSYNWLADVPGSMAESDLVEVTFKNTRKGFYRNTAHIDLSIGDMVAVEAAPGHDIGRVSLTGKLVELQMKRAGVKQNTELKRIFRIAKPGDLEKYEEARAREDDTMVKARRIAENLKLNMKIGDVEFQGDGNKAIFYYIADERVDFRQLIRILADTFKVRIEMKQIGARQEAGRIGGIGPCGRPLCCASWMTSFVTVGTAAARYQDISLNPQKLAGQCAKLKCCLNFEIDTYVESVKRMPGRDITLETADGTFYHFKTDIFKREITYSTDKSVPANLVTISAERAFEIISMNKRGEKPEKLAVEGSEKPKERKEFVEIVGQDSLTRFDKAKKKKKKKKPQGGEPKDGPKADNGKNGGNNKNTAGQPQRQPKQQRPQQQQPLRNRQAKQLRHEPSPDNNKPKDSAPYSDNQQ